MRNNGLEFFRSTISRIREMYLSDTVDASKKTAHSQNGVNKFGCATLPTKLKQTAPLGRNLASGVRQSSAPQMNPKWNKFEAKRQTSAPQISNQLPEEVREVYQKITSGQKVTTKKETIINVEQISPVLGKGGQVLHREAFKPASHFSEVRGYEKALPRQKVVSHRIMARYYKVYNFNIFSP